MQRLSILLLSTMLLVATSASASPKKQDEQAEAVKTMLDKRQYTIEVDYASPQRGRSLSLTSNYTLRVSNDTIHSHLPFYGRAYSIPYGGGEGLMFQAISTDYQVKIGKKGEYLITFTARSKEDTHRFHLTIFPNGSASVRVMPNNRSSMNYSGKVTP